MPAKTDESNSIRDKSSCFPRLIICLLLAGITLAAFWPATRLGYSIYDDEDYVTKNEHVQAGLSAATTAWAFTTDETGNWHPVTWLSLMLDTQLFGLGPASHHWVNLGLHTASVILLFLVLCRMTSGAGSSPAVAMWGSALVAALFAVHPLRVESVAWIAERKDVLCAFFLMLTLWQYTAYCQATQMRNAECGMRNIHYWLSLVFFALGLMSKAMIVSLPILLLLLDYWPLKRMAGLNFISPSPKNQFLLLEKLPFVMLCVACCIVTYQVQDAGGSVGSLNSLSLGWRIENALVSYGMYLEKTFWPTRLAVMYPIHDLPAWQVIVSAAVLVLVSLMAIRQIKLRPYLTVGWFWFLLMLLPVIGLVQIGKAAMADRYSYLPSIGLYLALAWTAAGLISGSKLWRVIGVVAAIALVAASLVQTRHQLGFWKDDVTMFQHSVNLRSSNNYEGYLFLANSLAKSGRLEESLTNYELSIHIEPEEFGHEVDAHYNMACVLAQLKRYPEAKNQIEDVIQHDSKNVKAHIVLGRILAIEKDYAGAQNDMSIAQSLAPGDPSINAALVNLQLKLDGQVELVKMDALLKTNPTPELLVKIAMMETVLEKYQDAVNHYTEALKLKPDSPEILNNMAWLLATCSDNTVRNGPQAVKYGEQAAKLTGYQQAMIIGTLAAAYAEAGRFDDAVSTAQRACETAKKSGDLDLLQKNQQLLEKYRNKEPYRDKSNTSTQ